MRVFRRSRPLVALASIFVVAAIGTGATFLARAQSNSNVVKSVPSAVAEKLLFSLYLPEKLPEGYAIDPTTFKAMDDVLLFAAKRPGYSNLVFTEVAAPKDYDYQNFYKNQMTSPTRIDKAPFESVYGLLQGSQSLSIVADNTWIIMSAGTHQSKDALELIANSIKKTN